MPELKKWELETYNLSTRWPAHNGQCL